MQLEKKQNVNCFKGAGRHEWKQIECGEWRRSENMNGQEMLLELIVYVPDRKLCTYLQLTDFWNENVTLNTVRHQLIWKTARGACFLRLNHETASFKPENKRKPWKSPHEIVVACFEELIKNPILNENILKQRNKILTPCRQIKGNRNALISSQHALMLITLTDVFLYFETKYFYEFLKKEF